MKPIVITDEGKNLLAAAVSGDALIQFSRICTYGNSKKIMQITPVSGITKAGGVCEIFGVMDNSELREGYSIEGLGVFALSGEEEILFGYCEENSDAFYMPAGNSENSRTEVTLRIALTADCSDKIYLSPNSDAYASAVQLREEIARLDDVINEKTDSKLTTLESRLEILESVLQSGSMENSTTVVFNNGDGIKFNGIWNTSSRRLEF